MVKGRNIVASWPTNCKTPTRNAQQKGEAWKCKHKQQKEGRADERLSVMLCSVCGGDGTDYVFNRVNVKLTRWSPAWVSRAHTFSICRNCVFFFFSFLSPPFCILFLWPPRSNAYRAGFSIPCFLGADDTRCIYMYMYMYSMYSRGSTSHEFSFFFSSRGS